jgi:predicted dehydrogenase
VVFAGAVDPTGDRYRTVHDRRLVFDSVPALLAHGSVDFAIVAVPTESHLPVAREVMAAGAPSISSSWTPMLMWSGSSPACRSRRR